MTTPCVLMLHHAQETVANKVANEIYEQTCALEKKYNFYHPDSWLTQTINERTVDTLVIDSETMHVLTQVREISQLTGDIFDICVGTIKSHNKLNTGKRTAQIAKFIEQNKASREQLIAEFQSSMGLKAWEVQGNQLYFNNPMTRIDLGGVIKEYAVDKAVAVLRKHGLTGMISFGGDLSVVGKKPDGKAYSIGIKDPFHPKKSCMSLPITDEALTTSGAYERQENIAGKKYHHIIKTSENSKTDVKPEILSATVVNKSTLVSGMMSTALMINPEVDLPVGCKVVLIDENAEVKARKS